MIENNIFAQFSSSLDRFGEFIDYPVVAGSVFNFQYNETLDSATIVLSQVPKEKRLSYIKPYDFVRVYDKSGNTGFDRVYLVDNFTETENNINEHIFGYTINLMSETKLLEKIQCPNLVVTHDVKNGVSTKKTILQKIQEYMELYVPKVKMSYDDNGTIKWRYEPLIKMSTGRQHFENGAFPEYGPEDFRILFSFYRLEKTIPLASVVSVDIDDIDVDTVVVSNVVIDTDIEFTGTVTFDKINKELFLDLSSLSRGTVNVSFTVSYYDTLLMKRFDVPCADLSFNYPTLRQLLTQLMMQVGCIPTVHNRKLGYLDYQIDAQNFNGGEYTVDNTVNKITRGLSSDSFANTLVNMSDSVLDSGNDVYSEALCFRDKNKVLLKQQENLFLETRFPIYKVQNFYINGYVSAKLTIKNIQTNLEVGLPGSGESSDNFRWAIVIDKISSNTVRLDLSLTMASSGAWFRIQGTVVAFKYDAEEKQEFNVDRIITSNNFVPDTSDIFDFILADETYDKVYFHGRISVRNTTIQSSTFGYDIFCSNFNVDNRNVASLYRQNITPLLVESSVRSNLSRNFLSATSCTTIEQLSDYVYGTVGYTIGSKRIEGFSDTFNIGESTATGWITAGYTYLENIWNCIVVNYQSSILNQIQESYGNLPTIYDYIYQDGSIAGGGNNVDISFADDAKPLNPIFGTNPVYLSAYADYYRWLFTGINFGYLWFDITYQPLNSFNLSYVKSQEPVDYPLEQYDGNASGLTDFDRLSIHEQEQVDRIGNETLSISQRATNISQIQNFDNGPLYFMDDTNRSGSIDSGDNGTKYIIFRYSFSINNNCFNVSYTGSKDAILKDYFTSIRTKYRAYEYVDYNSSVLRKEKDLFFVKISENGWYDGDDKVFFGDIAQANVSLQQTLMSKLILGDESIYNDTKNCILSSNSVYTKNDVSVIANSNSVGVIYEEFDNVSSGLYVPIDNWIQSMTNTANAYKFLMGGIPQEWQIWNGSYKDNHTVSFISKIDLKELFNDYTYFDSSVTVEIYNALNNILNLPIIKNELLTDKTVFSILENNNTLQKRKFYKDNTEVINHTIQFIYYTDSENILWGEEFLKLKSSTTENGLVFVDLTDKPFEIIKGSYTENPHGTTFSSLYSRYFTKINNGTSNPYIKLDWSNQYLNGIKQFKIVRVISNSHGANTSYSDVVAFKKGDDNIQKFYITLNDTKSDYVLAEKDGILYRAYKVKTYKEGDTNEGRVVEEIFEEDS